MISRKNAAEMIRTHILDKGWAHGYLAYGAGVQDRYYGDYRTAAGLAVKGHEGATYAFLSASGYVGELKGSFSVVGNTDSGNIPISAACPLLETVKRVLTGNASATIDCRSYESEIVV